MRPLLRRLAGLLDLRDVHAYAGLAMLGYGFNAIHHGAGWVAAGAALLWLGVRR